MDSNKYNQMKLVLEELSKADMSLTDALALARKHAPKEAADTIARHIYQSQMVPKMGNKFAYNDFLKRHGNDGVHLSMDMNSFSQINNEFGHDVGDQAIKQGLGSASEVARKHGLKSFHVSGDEARFHAATPERAMGFVKELKERLAKDPKIAGKHQISASIGIGHTPEHAETALMRAKDQLGPLGGAGGKRVKIHKPGEEPTVFHSSLEESPPANWRPGDETMIPKLPHEANASHPSSLKAQNPLKNVG